MQPNGPDSELVLRIRGQGYPQMPADGLNLGQVEEIESWIKAGAPLPKGVAGNR